MANQHLTQGNDLPKLTDKQRAFADAFIRLGKKKDAAIAAGFKPNSAAVSAAKMLKLANVAAYVAIKRAQHIAVVEEKHWLSTEWVLTELKKVYERSMQVEPVMQYDHREKQMMPTGQFVFDGKTAARCLEMAGKHLGMWGDKDSGEQSILNITIITDSNQLDQPDQGKVIDHEEATSIFAPS